VRRRSLTSPVAGEVEEHSEPEVGEEEDEFVGRGDAEDVWADQDPEEQLEDDHRRREAGWQDDDGHRRERGAEDDQEEGGGVDVDPVGGDRVARFARCI
jgi:hypothetical protein